MELGPHPEVLQQAHTTTKVVLAGSGLLPVLAWPVGLLNGGEGNTRNHRPAHCAKCGGSVMTPE